jgi:hypothetical protein
LKLIKDVVYLIAWKNGIVQNQCCLIDEPNAAFLSFVYDCTEIATHPFRKLKSRPTNILVTILVQEHVM